MVNHENRFLSYFYYRTICFYNRFKCEKSPHGKACYALIVFTGLNIIGILFLFENICQIYGVTITFFDGFIGLPLLGVTFSYHYYCFIYKKQYLKINEKLFTKKRFQGRKGTALVISYILFSFFFSTGMSFWGRYLNTGHL